MSALSSNRLSSPRLPWASMAPLLAAGLALLVLAGELVHRKLAQRNIEKASATAFSGTTKRLHEARLAIAEVSIAPLPRMGQTAMKEGPKAPPPAVHLRLDGILFNPDRPLAILNGQVWTVGQDIEGLVIETIEEHQVTIRHPGGTLTIMKLYDRVTPGSSRNASEPTSSSPLL